MPKLPSICVDFDGVIHSYSSGWQGADVVSDPPVPGAIDFLGDAVKHFTVCIYSSRSSQAGGIDAMKAFIRYWAGVRASWVNLLQFPTEKPAALITIDDRAIQFNGTFPTIQEIKDFKPWNRRT